MINMSNSSYLSLLVAPSMVVYPEPANNVYETCTWSHDKNGLDWAQKYPLCGSGYRQSPVALWSDNVHVDNYMPALQLHWYNESLQNSVLENNCHTIELTPGHSYNLPFVSGAGLDYTYRLHQLHFHWGTTDYLGSEHTFGEKQFPLEIHLVHEQILPKKNNNNTNDTMNKTKRYTVLALFAELSDHSSETLKQIVDAIGNIRYPGMETRINKVNLTDLFAKNMSNFIRYSGSLTTPPCSEVVEWVIIPAPIPITAAQLKSIRSVQLDHPGNSSSMMYSSNYRAPQPLNDRPIKSKYLVQALPEPGKSAYKSVMDILKRLLNRVLAIIGSAFGF